MPTIRLTVPHAHRINPARIAGVALFTLGTVALIVSIIYTSSILALIGLGLIFWAIILAYIQTEEYTKQTVLNATTIGLQSGLDQTLQYLGIKGKAVYLPPKYLNSPESNKIYIPRLETSRLPTPEQTRSLENQPITRTSRGLLINPPGAELTKLFEENLSTALMKMDLDSLAQHLPKLLIEDLEIAQNVEMQTMTSVAPPSTFDRKPADDSTIANLVGVFGVGSAHIEVHVKITSLGFRDITKQAQQLLSINNGIGCPLTSAIALAIAKAAGKPVTIDHQETSEDGKTVETIYQILEEEEQSQD